ncbi:MAG: TetR/AcrR family transcriptional regulator [bacterium]
MEPTDTKIRLLDTAEQLFAEKGVEATSLRTITAEADANLAAIHYHFGSKEVLIREVFARRIGPVNMERLRLLDELESRAGKKPLLLQKIIEAFIRPILLMHKTTDCDCRPFMRLMGRVYSESENVQKLVFGQFNEVAKRFISALQCALPKLSEIDISWRFKFMVGAMAMTVVSHAGFEKHLGEKNELVDMDSIINRLMPFLVGGFQAPAPILGE